MLGSEIIFLQVNGTLPSWPLTVPGLDLILIMKYLVTVPASSASQDAASIPHRFDDQKREGREGEGWYELELSLYAWGRRNKLTKLDTKHILFTPVTMIVGVTGPNLFTRQQNSESRANTWNWKKAMNVYLLFLYSADYSCAKYQSRHDMRPEPVSVC